jgi:hypothetical protein
MSYFLLILAFPFFVCWTVYGTYIFTVVSVGKNACTKKIESFSFLIFWFILCYTLIISYICVLSYAYAESRRSN